MKARRPRPNWHYDISNILTYQECLDRKIFQWLRDSLGDKGKSWSCQMSQHPYPYDGKPLIQFYFHDDNAKVLSRLAFAEGTIDLMGINYSYLFRNPKPR